MKYITLIIVILCFYNCSTSQSNNPEELISTELLDFEEIVNQEIVKLRDIQDLIYSKQILDLKRFNKISSNYHSILVSEISKFKQLGGMKPLLIVEYFGDYEEAFLKQSYAGVLFFYGGDNDDYLFSINIDTNGEISSTIEKVKLAQSSECNYRLTTILFSPIHSNRELIMTLLNENNFIGETFPISSVLTYTRIDFGARNISRIIPNPIRLDAVLSESLSKSLNSDDLIDEEYLLERIRKMLSLMKICANSSVPEVIGG